MNAARIAQHHVHKGGYAPLTPGGRPCRIHTFIILSLAILCGLVVAVCYCSHAVVSQLVCRCMHMGFYKRQLCTVMTGGYGGDGPMSQQWQA